MTDEQKAQLHQVRAAILGSRPDTSVSSTLYPVYVAVIAAGTYGLPASQQLSRSIDQKWLAWYVQTPAGAVAAVVLIALLLTAVRFAGQVRSSGCGVSCTGSQALHNLARHHRTLRQPALQQRVSRVVPRCWPGGSTRWHCWISAV